MGLAALDAAVSEVTKLSDKLRPGMRITTHGWTPASDGREFTVIETFSDGWLRAVNSEGKLRMFERTHVKRLP